jgi:hypothetical protein
MIWCVIMSWQPDCAYETEKRRILVSIVNMWGNNLKSWNSSFSCDPNILWTVFEEKVIFKDGHHSFSTSNSTLHLVSDIRSVACYISSFKFNYTAIFVWTLCAWKRALTMVSISSSLLLPLQRIFHVLLLYMYNIQLLTTDLPPCAAWHDGLLPDVVTPVCLLRWHSSRPPKTKESTDMGWRKIALILYLY